MFSVSVRRNRRVNLSAVPAKLRGPKHVKVGFPAGKADSDNIMKAVWNHFGTSRGIPERPFLSGAMRDNRSKYRTAMRQSAKKLLRGETALKTVLSKLGIEAQGDIQESITSWSTPPNAPSTIAQKGSSNPLIDTGEMRSSVTYIVGKL